MFLGLKCYSCSLVLDENAVDPDLTCVNTPANATGKPIVACPSRMKYCTIVRNDFTTTGKFFLMNSVIVSFWEY